MKNNILIIISVLILISCSLDEYGNEDIIFYNFSPQAVLEIKVFNTQRIGSTRGIKNQLVYTFSNRIETNDYVIFRLSRSLLAEEYFHMEVQIEDGEVYLNRGYFDHWGIRATRIILSVDYDLQDGFSVLGL